MNVFKHYKTSAELFTSVLRNIAELFVNSHVINIINDMIYPNLLGVSSLATYVPYIRVDRMRISHKDVLYLLIDLGKNVKPTRSLAITNLGDPSLYIASEKVMFNMIQSTEAFVKNYQNSIYLHADELYRHGRVPFGNVHACH